MSQRAASVVLLCLALAWTGSVATGLRPPPSRPNLPAVEVTAGLQPRSEDASSLASLLAINEQAAAFAGYPAMVATGDRRAVAAQAALQIQELASRAAKASGPYAERQVAALEAMQRGLEAYARGKGAARLVVASATNEALREELASLLASAARHAE